MLKSNGVGKSLHLMTNIIQYYTHTYSPNKSYIIVINIFSINQIFQPSTTQAV